jgi:hypothetical protein
MKDKSTCSADALAVWEEVNEFSKEGRNDFFCFQLIEK